MKIEAITKAQMEATLDMENPERISGVIIVCMTNRIQEIEEKVSSVEDIIEELDTTIKENNMFKKVLI